MSIHVSALHVYPVKSCHGIELQQALVGPRGIAHDRSWLVVSPDGQALTQRENARLALIQTSIANDQTLVLSAVGAAECTVKKRSDGTRRKVRVWRDDCAAIDQGDEAAGWISQVIGTECRLVTMEDDFIRLADPSFTSGGQQVGFADDFPFLLISEASLADLNNKLEFPVPMNRFRPNIVVSGCTAFAEDEWKRIRIGTIEFDVVKPCARCVITTIDQDDAIAGREPLRTLAAYRKFNNSLLFGQNLVHHSLGTICVGDQVEL